MTILFLTLLHIDNIQTKGIYTDMIRCFQKNRHELYVVCPVERKYKKNTVLTNDSGVNLLHVRIGNIQKCNLLEKGISTLLIKKHFLTAINKYMKNTHFDLVLYSTPPITFSGIVKYIKNRDNATSYLLLKDIFPQNAIDIKLFTANSLTHKYFLKQETELYKVSDYIGCLSQANIAYIQRNHPYLNSKKLHVNPNCVEIVDDIDDKTNKNNLRCKYSLPLNKTIFVYGGNLGRPQDIPFIISCLQMQENNEHIFFLIIGSGTEYEKLHEYVCESSPEYIKLMPHLPVHEYENVLTVCDVGLIFLDHRFTIPNFPSRLLGYMQAELPVLACTDISTDIGQVIVEGEFGWWCESNDPQHFSDIITQITACDIVEKGKNSKKYLVENYASQRNYDTIINYTSKDIQ